MGKSNKETVNETELPIKKYADDPDFLEYVEGMDDKKPKTVSKRTANTSKKPTTKPGVKAKAIAKDGNQGKKIVDKVFSSIKKIPISFVIAYIFDIIYGILYYRNFNFIQLYDTASYDQAADRIFKGQPDLLRTPVFPVFLRTCRNICKPENYIIFPCIVQIVFFYISIIFFFKLIGCFTKNPVARCMGTIFYGCFSPIIVYNTMLLTESLAITTIVIFAYILVSYLQKNKNGYLIASILLCFFMTMLRPSALYLYIVVATIMIPYFIKLAKGIFGANKEENKLKKTEYIPAITFLLSVLALFGYMDMNKDANNYYGLSYVSEMNRFYDVVLCDIWEDNPDTEIVESIRTLQEDGTGVLGSATQTEKLFRNMDYEARRLIKFNEYAISHHRDEFINYLVKKSLRMGENNMLYNLSHDSNFIKEDGNKDVIWIGDFLDCNVNFVYFTFLLEAVLLIATAIKNKKLIWDHLAIALIIGGQLGVNVIAGPAEFHRLNIPCYPFSLLLIIIWTAAMLETMYKKTEKVQESKADAN